MLFCQFSFLLARHYARSTCPEVQTKKPLFIIIYGCLSVGSLTANYVLLKVFGQRRGFDFQMTNALLLVLPL